MPLPMINKSPSHITYLTAEGYQRLQSELHYLKDKRRPEIAELLHELIDDVDLIENNEFLLMKDEQAVVEGRIQELEHLLARVEIIRPKTSTAGAVRLGSVVTVQQEDLPEETFTIVGSTEANTGKGLISDQSPLGRALMDHQENDEVEIQAPDGRLRFKILRVE